MKLLKYPLLLLILLNSCVRTLDEETKVVFNIPSLIGKNIDEILKQLGEPDERLHIDPNDSVAYYQFTRESWLLSVKYNPKSRKVIDFSIWHLPIVKIIQLKDLLRIGNVDSVAFGYVVIPENLSETENGYTNITVVPRF